MIPTSPNGSACGPSARRGSLAAFALATATALVAGCAQPLENPVVWDSKTSPPTIEPQLIDGKCTLVISGTATVADKAISRVSVTVERGLAQIDVHLAPPTQWTTPTFHVVVPVEEQHVSVVYVGATRYPIWERGAGGKDSEARLGETRLEACLLQPLRENRHLVSQYMPGRDGLYFDQRPH